MDENLVDFIKQNILLIGLALGSAITLLWPMLGRAGAGSALVTVTEAVMLMSRKQLLILDVREPDEFTQGHIQNARNIPLSQLEAKLVELQKFREKPVLVICQSGVRARKACQRLKTDQWTDLHLLEGGMQAWTAANMPLIKP